MLAMRPRTRLIRSAARLGAGFLLLILPDFAGAATAPAPMLCKPPASLLAFRTGEPPPPADSRGFDVLAYDLELRLDPARKMITGRLDLRFRAEDNLTLVLLDLVPELTVSEVSDHLGTLSFSHVDERLELDLRAPLAPGAVDSLTISWSGRPPRHGSFSAGLMFRDHDAGTRDDPTDDVPIIANLSEPWSAHSWWPCKDHPADKAMVKLAVTVPDSLVAVGNGTLFSVTAAEPGWRRYAWREHYPLPTYLVSVAVSNYATWSEDCRPAAGPDVRLDYYVFPQDRPHAEFDLANTCGMMSFLTGLLGPWPYPGEKYAQVEFKWIGGMEHTTATSLAQYLFTGNRRFETLFLHEMVHQWFGDSLTPAVWADIWLNEGFARYGEALWLEYSQGSPAYDDFMHLIGPGSHPDLFLGAGVLNDPDPILPNFLVYDKGAWVLHMLRALLGDDAFFAFLREYANDPRLRYGIVTTNDMIAAVEAAAGRPLGDFFTPWLTTDLVPVISHRIRSLADGRVELVLSQHQLPVFQIPVPIVLHGACGESHVTALLTRAEQSFVWPFPCALDSVSIAPDGLALLRTLDSPPPPLTVDGPAPNPTSAVGTDFMLFLTVSSEVIVTTYDTRGMSLDSEALGHLAANNPDVLPMAPGHRWHWSALDAGGRRLPAGLYYLEFKSRTGRQVRHVTLLR